MAATAERSGLEPLLPARGGGRADPAARRDHLANRRRCAPLRCLRLRPAAPGCPPDRRRGVTQHSDFKADPWEVAAHPRLHELPGLRRSGARLADGPAGARDARRIRGVRPDGEPTTRSSPARGPGYTPPWPSRSSADMTSSAAPAHRVPDRGLLGRVAADGPADRESATRTCPRPGPGCSPTSTGWWRRSSRTQRRPRTLSSLLDPAAPPLPALRRDWIWRVVRWPSTRAGSLTTLGMLPPTLRDASAWSGVRAGAALPALAAIARRAGR